MVKGLPDIPSYSVHDIEKAFSLSPALLRYKTIGESSATAPLSSSAALRARRHKAWSETAVAALLRSSDPETICRYWSDRADAICSSAWKLSGCDHLPLAMFALGKWGSQELNLSSDIDVVFVSETNPTAEMLKLVRSFIALLSEATEFGFCFRVDTDLKPGGRLAPLVASLKQFEDYYWSSGETWERLALVRLRPIVGPENIVERTTEIAQKFVFRRYIDFALLDDLRHLRSQIHSHYPQVHDDRRNIKLSPGGIRDIELFIHALQVIHGGKDPSLRTPSTGLAAKRLADAGRFSSQELEFLISTYWRFRELENHIQAIEDRQTHDWSARDGADELREFQAAADRVDKVVEAVLGKTSLKPLMPRDTSELNRWLGDLGYNEHSIKSRIPELLSLTAVSTKTYQDEELRLRVIRQFLEDLAATALDKDLGLALLIDFFRATRAKTGFFSLLAIEDRLIRELSLLFGCSPYLGGIIAARPEILDSYLMRAQARPSDNFETMLEELAERRLITEIISANQFLHSRDLPTLCAALTACADAICLQLLNSLKDSIGVSEVSIVALGKWGGYELGFSSDLDFIFVTPNDPTENDQKIARRFLSRLTEAHKGGSIYTIDMRLRPSGKGGLLLVSEASLLDYLKTKAEAWERQSYLRARVIGGNSRLTSAIRSMCVAKPLSAEDFDELARIRKQLVTTPDTDTFDLKLCTGGLVDIEFAAQIAVLSYQLPNPPAQTSEMVRQLATVVLPSSSPWHLEGPELIENYGFLRLVEQLFRLTTLHPGASFHIEDDGFKRVARILALDSKDLASRIASVIERNTEILKNLDLRRVGT